MIKEIGRATADWAIKNTPTILTAVGAAGVVLTAVSAGKASIKAKQKLDELPEDADIKEKAKVVAPIMARPFLLGAATLFCIFASNHEHLKREGAIAAAYTLSSKAFEEYEEKVVGTIGESKNKKIKDAIAEDTIAKNPPSETLLIGNDSDKTLCFDKWTGRYFKARIEDIDRAVNEVNYIINTDGFAALNEFYERIGLDPVEEGEDIGWSASYEGLMNLERSSQLYNNETPVLVLTFIAKPKEYFCD